MLLIVLIAFAALLTALVSGTRAATDAKAATSRALGLASAALIARAAADTNRPGSLPCPDTNNDGVADLFAGVSCPSYVGRLPWLTLDLPELHDASGERLWYALSANYRDHSAAGTLNSDTAGQLSVSVNAAPASNDVVAVIFAPGLPVPGQNRTAATVNAVSNYLEGTNADGDNSFEAGPLSPPVDTFNDQAVYVTRDMLMAAVEQRVAREARYCLGQFAAANAGRFPWAAPMAVPPAYADQANTRAGRIPLTFNATEQSEFGAITGTLAWPASMQPGTRCFDPTTWWGYWSQSILYHLAAAYDPSHSPVGGPCAGACLTVNGATDVRAVAIVAGRALTSPDQSGRFVPPGKANVANYLETEPVSGVGDQNGPTTGQYAKARPPSPTNPVFNDRVECIQESGLSPC
jgi:hypothetical protein